MVKSSQGRKAQVIAEATRLFSRMGFERVTMKHLAEACGITEPALYRHFSSKDDLYDHVLESIALRLDHRALFESLENENDLTRLLSSLANHMIEFYTKNADLYRLLLFSALSGHAKAKQVFDGLRGTYVRFLIAQLDRLYAAGVIIRKHNDITARCFVGMVFDCSLARTLWKGYQGKAYRLSEVIANNVPIYVRGLEA